MQIRNRIKELRILQPGEYDPNPRNWRAHPQQQRDALRGILADIGIADTLVAYYSARAEGRLVLIDGHERATVEAAWPALILDVTDEEADKLLATLDPLAAMAETQGDKLEQLLADVSTDSPALAQMLTNLAESAGIVPLLEQPDELSDIASDEQLGEFGDGDAGDAYVRFAFGDYRGLVGRAVYEGFVAQYKAQQQTGDAVLLDDVLRGWLDV